MDNNYNNNNGSGDGNKPGGQRILALVIAALATILVMTYFMRAMTSTGSREISYSDFIGMIDEKKIESVVIESDRIDIIPKVGSDELKFNPFYGSATVTTYYTGKAEDDSTLTQRLLDAEIPVSSEVPDSSSAILNFILYYILPILIMYFALSYVFRRMSKGGGPLGIGKNNAKVYMQRETGVTFKDVAGEDEAKESLVEVVDFLHNPGRYVKIGAKLPKGALLVGPPGTGKTLLAKAVAGEAHVPFYSLAGSDFIELYVGVGASRVRELFEEASKNAPCIIFIDEIDAIGRSRDNKYGGNEEREQTLNQLLSEMDGFDSSKGVLVLGATNRPEILDKALLRPGRFDRRIIVDKPDLKGREEILKVHSKDVKMDETVDLNGIALATSGAVGSDLANMINEAAINAVKDHREYVCQQDLMEAVEQVLVGKEKKDRILSKEERKIVSYHEVGHALISAVQKNTEPVQKITIVPRTMGALGYVMQVPEDEKYLQTRDELIDDIIVTLGGRAAEEVLFNTVTTGAENDIEKATSMARSMITMYGMSERFGLMQLESVQNRYLDGNRVLNCSDQTASEVDDEVKKLLASCYDKAKQIIREHLDAMDKIAQFLIEKETITGKEFMKIYREVENLSEPTEEETEAAKRSRIYTTRPESASVGENIPVRSERKKDDGASLEEQNVEAAAVPAASALSMLSGSISGNAQEETKPVQTLDSQEPSETVAAPAQAAESPKEESGATFDTEINDASVLYNHLSDGESVVSGGRFSHVPDNFDNE